MTRIVMDDALKARLGDLSQPAELCDESGRVLAIVTPAAASDPYKGLESPHDDEELRRRAKEENSYTTAEVLQHLEQL